MIHVGKTILISNINMNKNYREHLDFCLIHIKSQIFLLIKIINKKEI